MSIDYTSQVLEDNDYGRAVDWWGVGVVSEEIVEHRFILLLDFVCIIHVLHMSIVDEELPNNKR